MKRRLRLAMGSLGLLALVAVTGAGSEGCRNPTQVTVELRTIGALPCASLRGIKISVGPTPSDAEEKLRLGVLSAEVSRGVCEPDGRTVGTLVITPGASAGAIVLAARYSDDQSAPCIAPDYKGCIVARRSFTFIDHTPLTLPISLDLACADVPCDVVSSCRSGTCVSSETQCSESSGTCESAAEPVVLPDGGTVPPDGAPPLDATTPTDSALKDSAKDGPTDAPFDVDPSKFGNLCPTMGGGVDCFVQAQTCCYMGSYFCGTGCPAGYYVFNCHGRKHCGSGYCCGQPNGGAATPGSSCDTSAGQMCSQNGNHYICTTDADCPPSRPKCSGIYYDVGTGVTKECIP